MPSCALARLRKLMDEGVTIFQPDELRYRSRRAGRPGHGDRPVRAVAGLNHNWRRLRDQFVFGVDATCASATASRCATDAFWRIRWWKTPSLGPYCHVRPASHIGAGAHVGNFVETKKTTLGRGSKANHLTYLGDAEIGEGVNVGAGTITCNYDGVHKHKTVIGDGAFIGSDTTLVAPVRVAEGAYVGAGSCITQDVPADALAVARGMQVNKPEWAKKRREKLKNRAAK